jgi:hypothetical protein
LTSSFDLGRSNDGDAWSQFVVFGGDPTGTITVDQTINWLGEPGFYFTSDGTACTAGDDDCSLQVPTTVVRLDELGDPVPVVPCAPGPAFPDGKDDCLKSRSVVETPSSAYPTLPLVTTEITLTEDYMFRADPPRFR